MNSIDFPYFLSGSSTKVVSGHDATYNNLRLLLKSDKYGLFGDPDFGTNLKRLLFNQNNMVLRDIVIDDIYTAIIIFLPQILVERKNITITSDGTTLYANIKAQNMLDYTTNIYNLSLMNYEDVEWQKMKLI